tara:strand:- start:239 stop:472 length:234 start_codon:yes stop_codon:yes gene_type:complete
MAYYRIIPWSETKTKWSLCLYILSQPPKKGIIENYFIKPPRKALRPNLTIMEDIANNTKNKQIRSAVNKIIRENTNV